MRLAPISIDAYNRTLWSIHCGACCRRQTQKIPLKGLNGVKPEGGNWPSCCDHLLFSQLIWDCCLTT
uniref:Uncharacterized protein n=1 Tax=Escherichia coli TaxID=562 RepID=A0A7G9A9Z7_ECOLX|nr:hypothetical protein [Escherichia coli]